MTGDWTGYDYLAARLERQPQGYLLTAQQRGELRRYLLRALPPATFNPGEAGHGEAIRAAIAQALRHVADDPKLLELLESKSGFVFPEH